MRWVTASRPQQRVSKRENLATRAVVRRKQKISSLPSNEERMKSILIEEAYRAIKVRDGSREVTITMIRAVVRSMALAAVKGQARSQRMFTALLQATEKERKAEHDLTLETAIEYKTHWEDELERRTALGIVGPDPIPHPDDVIINVKTGEVHITGPVTKQEKVKWDSGIASTNVSWKYAN